MDNIKKISEEEYKAIIDLLSFIHRDYCGVYTKAYGLRKSIEAATDIINNMQVMINKLNKIDALIHGK